MTAINNILRVASQLEESDPILSYELAQSVRRFVGSSVKVSIVNPGVQTFEEHIEHIVAVLKSISQELDSSLKDLDDAKEFAKFFKDGLAEEKELKELLNRSESLGKIASGRTSGFGDWFRGVTDLFKKENNESEEEGLVPSYTLDESTIDDFVDGSSEWTDASNYVEEEYRENKEFFSGVKDVLKELDELKKSPSQKMVQDLITKVKQFTKFGENMIKGVRKHLLEPAAKITIEDDDEKPQSKDKGSSLKLDLEGTVGHYIDALKGALGDNKKTVSLLKELFSQVSPAVKEEMGEIGLAARVEARKRVLPMLIKLAYNSPSSRKVLVPIIRHASRR